MGRVGAINSIVNCMRLSVHVDNAEVQAAGAGVLWDLCFKNSASPPTFARTLFASATFRFSHARVLYTMHATQPVTRL